MPSCAATHCGCACPREILLPAAHQPQPHPLGAGDAGCGFARLGGCLVRQRRTPPRHHGLAATGRASHASGRRAGVAGLLRRLTRFTLPLDLDSGSAFEQAVWRASLAVPHGQSTSYGALATQLGKPGASRAIGAALGRNPLSMVVPCHRVLGRDGRLTGFAAGLDRKQALLELEQMAYRA